MNFPLQQIKKKTKNNNEQYDAVYETEDYMQYMQHIANI